MDNLYILTKQEFTSLYRFGQIPLNLNKIIKTENRNDEEINVKIYEEFLSLPYFVGDEEYLIISFENFLIRDFWLEIEYVSEIIPLTKAAKNSLQMKFDTKLDFKDARFESTVHKVEEQIDIQERFRGAKAFWKLCGIRSSYKPGLQNEINEIIISGYNKRITGVKSSDFKEDYFIHLLAYDRYEFFPNSDLGYFYDIGEIFAHSKGKPSFKGSSFHFFLEDRKQELSNKSFIEIADIISKSEEIINFTEQLTINGLKKYLASAIFLKFKADLTELDTIKGSDTGKLVGKLSNKKEYINELNLAVYLTGSFFGYNKFYDDLYDLAELNIFKKKEKQLKKEVNIEKTKNVIPPSDENTTLQPNINTNKQISEKENLDISKAQKNNKEIAYNADTNIKSKKAGSESNENILEKNNSIPHNPPKSSEKEYSGIQNHILETILKMLEEEKGTIEIKTDRMNELKKILSPLSVEKNISKKDDVVQIIKEKFSDKIIIEAKGKKYIISRKRENDLFANA